MSDSILSDLNMSNGIIVRRLALQADSFFWLRLRCLFACLHACAAQRPLELEHQGSQLLYEHSHACARDGPDRADPLDALRTALCFNAVRSASAQPAPACAVLPAAPYALGAIPAMLSAAAGTGDVYVRALRRRPGPLFLGDHINAFHLGGSCCKPLRRPPASRPGRIYDAPA